MVEWAVFSKFTITTFLPEFARCGLKVWKTSSSGALCNILRKRIIGLSKFWRTMSKLAVRFERTIWVLDEMLAHLGLILLFQRFNTAMTSLVLTCDHLELLHDLMRRVIEVTRTSICVVTFSLISSLCRGLLTNKATRWICCLQWSLSVLFGKGTRTCCHLVFLLLRLLSFWGSIKRSLSRILAFYYINFIMLILLIHWVCLRDSCGFHLYSVKEWVLKYLILKYY